jgi:hypothetical protein
LKICPWYLFSIYSEKYAVKIVLGYIVISIKMDCFRQNKNIPIEFIPTHWKTLISMGIRLNQRSLYFFNGTKSSIISHSAQNFSYVSSLVNTTLFSLSLISFRYQTIIVYIYEWFSVQFEAVASNKDNLIIIMQQVSHRYNRTRVKFAQRGQDAFVRVCEGWKITSQIIWLVWFSLIVSIVSFTARRAVKWVITCLNMICRTVADTRTTELKKKGWH